MMQSLSSFEVEMMTSESSSMVAPSISYQDFKPSALLLRRSGYSDPLYTVSTAQEWATSQWNALPIFVPPVVKLHQDTLQASALLEQGMTILQDPMAAYKPHSLFALLSWCPHNPSLDLYHRLRKRPLIVEALHLENLQILGIHHLHYLDSLPPLRSLNSCKEKDLRFPSQKLSNMCTIFLALQQLLGIIDRIAHRFPLVDTLLSRTPWKVKDGKDWFRPIDIRWEGGAITIFHSNIYNSSPYRANATLIHLSIFSFNCLSVFASQDYPKPIKTSKRTNHFDKKFEEYNHFMDPLQNPFPSHFFSYFPTLLTQSPKYSNIILS